MSKSKKKISAIVAMAENRIIGRDNSLIWHLPDDLKHFKKTTMGKPMIMGRKSFDSLPGTLPGRPHIIITRKTSMADNAPVYYAPSLKEAIDKASNLTQENEIFITGGGQIYEQSIDLIDRLYLTLVHADYDGDTYFPKIKWDHWDITDTQEFDEDGDKPAFTIMTLDRINAQD